MDKTWWFLVFLGLPCAVGALASGGVEAKAEEGRLTCLQSWWDPAPGWRGRWWWREAGGGAAWVRAGVFQVGPLTASAGDEGWREWAPGPTLSSGHWGVAADGDTWGIWAIQKPELLEGGVQGRLDAGPWSLAVGTDRTWSVEAPVPETNAWVDRARAGLVFDRNGDRAGVEGTLVQPVSGPLGWWCRSRVSGSEGPWSWVGTGSYGTDPIRKDKKPWEAAATLGWKAWSVGWAGNAVDRWGAAKVGARSPRLGGYLSWGPLAGWEADGKAETRTAPVNAGLEALAGDEGRGVVMRGGVFLSGKAERGNWSGSCWLCPGATSPEATVEASWKEPTMEAEARWKVEGMRLGWIGPGTEFDLTVRWFF